MPWFTLLAVALCLVTVVVPELLLRWAARRRRPGLTLLLTLPAIVAIVLTAYRSWTADAMPSIPALAPFSAYPAPTFVWIIFCGFMDVTFVRQVWTTAARGRRWAFGIVLAVFALQLIYIPWMFAPDGMGPSERILWDRWYLIPIQAAHNTGFWIVVWKVLSTSVRGLWRGLRAVITRARPKPARPVAPEPVLS
jgi:hypothetical protein